MQPFQIFYSLEIVLNFIRLNMAIPVRIDIKAAKCSLKLRLLHDAAPLPLANLLGTVQESFNRIFSRDDVAFTGFEMPNGSELDLNYAVSNCFRP